MKICGIVMTIVNTIKENDKPGTNFKDAFDDFENLRTSNSPFIDAKNALLGVLLARYLEKRVRPFCNRYPNRGGSSHSLSITSILKLACESTTTENDPLLDKFSAFSRTTHELMKDLLKKKDTKIQQNLALAYQDSPSQAKFDMGQALKVADDFTRAWLRGVDNKFLILLGDIRAILPAKTY